MIWNYLKIAWRNLSKDRTFTVLNITGLTVAFCIALLLCMYALFELSFDSFHKNVDQVYQVYSTDHLPEGPEATTARSVPFAGALKEEVPGVEEITRFNSSGVLVLENGKELRMIAAYVDPSFFSIFTYPVVKGKTEDPIEDKSAVTISENAAIRIFGNTDVIGKTIRIMNEGEEEPFRISAVLADIPQNSSVHFDLALDFSNQSDFVYADNLDQWDKQNHEVYLKLSEGISVPQFEKSTHAFTDLHYKQEIASAKRDGAQPDINGNFKQLRLFPYRDIHFSSIESGVIVAKRTWTYLVLGVAFLVIFIAGVNFINMSIAKSSQRLREIGMRKTMGAGKVQLFLQFWGESILVFLTSLILAALVAGALLDSFKTLFKTKATLANVATPEVIAGSFLCLLLITLIAGGYPALLLSKIGTIQALKGKTEVAGKNRLRDLLMVLQFGIAILLISGTFVLWNQLEFMRTKDLGFNKDQVIAFPLNGKRNDARAIQLLREELSDEPGILNITAANNILGIGKDGTRSTSVLGFEHKGRGIQTNMLVVDHDYIETLGLELVEGRSFSRNYASDSTAVVINEAMAMQLQEKDPLRAQLTFDWAKPYSIIGIVENYNFQDLDKRIEPLTLFLNPDWNMRYVYVKVAPQNPMHSFEQIEAVWRKIEPNAEFMGSFLDENVERTLRRERTMATLISSGSVIAIILSCIGLFAMSLLVVAQRRKEIGIRKVVGASVSGITLMLTKDFIKLVAVSFLVAAPVAWWLTSRWLQNYPYRIDLNIWIFIAAGLLAAVIAVVTISFKTVKAALQNPAKSLKTE